MIYNNNYRIYKRRYTTCLSLYWLKRGSWAQCSMVHYQHYQCRYYGELVLRQFKRRLFNAKVHFKRRLFVGPSLKISNFALLFQALRQWKSLYLVHHLRLQIGLAIMFTTNSYVNMWDADAVSHVKTSETNAYSDVLILTSFATSPYFVSWPIFKFCMQHCITNILYHWTIQQHKLI